MVIEFLLEHYDSLFQYEYTKRMEDTLDVIEDDINVAKLGELQKEAVFLAQEVGYK